MWKDSDDKLLESTIKEFENPPDKQPCRQLVVPCPHCAQGEACAIETTLHSLLPILLSTISFIAQSHVKREYCRVCEGYDYVLYHHPNADASVSPEDLNAQCAVTKVDKHGLPLHPQPSDDPEDPRAMHCLTMI